MVVRTAPPSELASLGERLGGQILDAAVALLPMIAVAGLGAMAGPRVPVGPIGVSWALFYLWFSDGFARGQSFGKRALGTAVVDRVTGEPCTFSQSFTRNFLLSILGPIDSVFIFGAARERLGDKAAKTRVVKRPA